MLPFLTIKLEGNYLLLVDLRNLQMKDLLAALDQLTSKMQFLKLVSVTRKFDTLILKNGKDIPLDFAMGLLSKVFLSKRPGAYVAN